MNMTNKYNRKPQCCSAKHASAMLCGCMSLLSCAVIIAFLWAGTCAAAGSAAQGRGDEEVVNPHFTGKHCNECHERVPEKGDREMHLKFGGDDIALCNSCHDKKYVKGDLHPVGIVPPEADGISIPQEFPLYGGKVTCLTCHEAYVQCEMMPAHEFENINFLRGAPYDRSIDICFRCHDREAYRKVNPHEQVDESGAIRKEQCLYCHQSLPEAESVAAMEEVTFKTENAAFCAACHGKEEHYHPADAEHVVDAPEDMVGDIATAEKTYDVILPLFEGRIFCGTCHNPHDTGVITRAQAAKGAAEDKKLRLDPSRELCVACHRDKDLTAEENIALSDVVSEAVISPAAEAPGGHAYHKSFVEQDCRACHQVTRESPGRPIVYNMCFQADCHDTAILKNTYRHEEALQADCLLCHSPHGSRYGAHILSDQQKLCKACHPLLSGRPEQEPLQQDETDYHDKYFGVFELLAAGEQMTCGYCHGEDHSGQVREQGIVSCFRCHNYIESLVREKQGRTKNIHETLKDFKGSRCTLCHDPHSSPYPALLKKERDAYLSR